MGLKEHATSSVVLAASLVSVLNMNTSQVQAIKNKVNETEEEQPGVIEKAFDYVLKKGTKLVLEGFAPALFIHLLSKSLVYPGVLDVSLNADNAAVIQNLNVEYKESGKFEFVIYKGVGMIYAKSSKNTGKTRKVVLAYGGQGSNSMAALHKLNFKQLLDDGYDIIAPDRVGYGKSKLKTGWDKLDNNDVLSRLYNLVRINEKNSKQTADIANEYADSIGATEKIVCAYSLGAVEAQYSVAKDPNKTTKLILDSPMPGKVKSAQSIGDFISNTLNGKDSITTGTRLGKGAAKISAVVVPRNYMDPKTIMKNVPNKNTIDIRIITGDAKSDMFSEDVTHFSKDLQDMGFKKLRVQVVKGSHHSENGLYNILGDEETP